MAFLADEVEGIIDAALDGTLGEKETDKAKFATAGGGHRRDCDAASWRGSERMTDLIGSGSGLDPAGLTKTSWVPTTDEPQKAQGLHQRPGGPLVPGLR